MVKIRVSGTKEAVNVLFDSLGDLPEHGVLKTDALTLAYSAAFSPFTAASATYCQHALFCLHGADSVSGFTGFYSLKKASIFA